MRGTRNFAAIAAAVFAAAALPAAAHEAKRVPAPGLSETPHLALIRRAPGFTLRDPAGREVRLSQLRDRTVLVAFVYTSCSSACPLLSWRMALLQKNLAAAGLAGRTVLLSVTVDPQRDDAATLARFAKGLGAGPGWHFLRESPARLQPVLDAYEEWTRRVAGELDHPARLHLIDAKGYVREIYSLAFFNEAQAFLDILALEREAAPAARK
jgi:protein SCO1